PVAAPLQDDGASRSMKLRAPIVAALTRLRREPVDEARPQPVVARKAGRLTRRQIGGELVLILGELDEDPVRGDARRRVRLDVAGAVADAGREREPGERGERAGLERDRVAAG